MHSRSFFLLLVVISFAACDHLDWKPERVHLVDVNTSISNFLFRGNEPLLKNTTTGELYWPLDLFDERLRQVAMSERNLTLPEKYYLIDINFETYIDESSDLNNEHKYFKNKAVNGEFWHWTLIGDFIPPVEYPEPMAKTLAKTLPAWNLDRLHERLPQVNEALNNKREDGIPVVIYFHCEAGEDRTGEFCGAYQMQYLGWTFSKAMDYANHIETRDIHSMSKNGMQWYCFYLKYAQGQSERDCVN